MRRLSRSRVGGGRCLFIGGLSALALTVFGRPAAAQTTRSDLDELELLSTVPLPGETMLPETPDKDAISSLVGRTITEVLAKDPPPGFKPIEDANIPLGIALSRDLVRRAVHRLWETGRYRDVKISAILETDESVALIIAVEPMLRIKRLRINGNKALDEEEVARAIGYTPGQTILPDPAALRALRDKLVAVYGEYGYREARASLSILTTEEPGSVEMTIEVTEGEPERYKEITVKGLPKSLSPDILGLKEGMIRDIGKVEVAVEKLLKALAEAGYLDAVALPAEERRIGRYSIALTIPLNPGIPTTLRFKGNEHFLSRDLRELIEADGTARTNPGAIARKLVQLEKHYKSHGYLFADIQAVRECYPDPDDRKGEATIVPLRLVCPKGTVRQTISLFIREGPHVEVAQVLFEGNTWFSDEDLQEELFAFITEQNKSDDVFQPLTLETVDDVGMSDKRPEDTKHPSGLKASQFRRTRVYLTEQYAQGMNHLMGIYQEQGFLDATVHDTCDLSHLTTITYRQMRFVPLKLARDDESSGSPSDTSGSPCVFINDDRDHLMVTVTVDEGAQTRLSEIKFQNNRVLSSKDLQQTAGLSVWQPYNEYRFREAARKIKERYRNDGYMFAEVTWEQFFSDNRKRARVEFNVVEGPLTRVGLIRIEGAETTSKRLIWERLDLEPGELITPEALETSQIRLMELGIFDGATVQMVTPETPAKTKNIRVLVSEAKPQYLELRWGIATVEGLRTGFEYGFKNIGGFAVNARIHARGNYRLFFIGNPDFEARYDKMDLLERLEHHVLVGVGSPHLPGTKGLLGWGIDAIKERLNKPGFSADRFTTFLRLNSTTAFGIDYPHGLIAEVRTGIEYNINIESGVSGNPFLRYYQRLPQGESAFYVVGLNLSFDLRDSPFSPSKGFYLSIGADWVKSIPIGTNAEERYPGDPQPIEKESNLIRAELTAAGYVPLFKTEMVLAFSFTIGYIFHLIHHSTTWPDRYFYVGGVDTLRGFAEDSLMPEDMYEEWKKNLKHYGDDIDGLLDSTGGEAMLVTRVELRYPLAKGFYGAGFTEFGNLWRDRMRMYPITTNPFEIHLRPVAGIGLRYQTPIGPVSFDWGLNLYRRPREDPFAWYLSIGSAL